MEEEQAAMGTLEKRMSKRQPVSLFVNQEYNDRQQRLCMSLDISPEGMTVVSLAREGRVAQGSHAWLRFWLPGQNRPIHALGEVVHRQRDEQLSLDRTGMRFKFLFPDQRRMLEQYLREAAAAGC